MSKKLLTYTFSVSGPLPDENGVIMQGTAYRVQRLNGEALAYDTKHAMEMVLSNEQVKEIADYNKINTQTVIDGTKAEEPSMVSITFLENGLAVSFSLKEKENMIKE